MEEGPVYWDIEMGDTELQLVIDELLGEGVAFASHVGGDEYQISWSGGFENADFVELED
jgi:hypothetical protein